MEYKKYYISDENNPEKSVPTIYFLNLFDKNKNWKRVEDENINKDINFTYTIGSYIDVQQDCITYRFKPKHRNFLTNKSILYKTIRDNFKELSDNHMAYQVDVDINNLDQYKKLFDEKKFLILKPTWGFERSGIQIFNTYDKFLEFMKNKGIYTYKKAIERDPSNTYVLAEYITNLLKYNNRILDFRIFFLVSYIDNIYRGYIIKPIVMNLSPYEQSEKIDPSKTIENITLPGNYADYFFTDLQKEIGREKTKIIMNQIKHIVSHLLKLIKKYKIMEPYEDNAYELFGLDMMVDKDYRVRLIEFNEKTGVKGYTEDVYENMSSAFIHATINKKYEDTKYEIKLDENIKKNIIRISTFKKYI